MTIGDIKIEGVEYKQLLNIEIIEAAHRHGICKLTFIADSKVDTKKILSWNKTQIKVKADKDIIFAGIINSCSLEKKIEGNFLFVTALSLSSQLEGACRTMSFQSAKKKFSDILSAVKKNYGAADLTCAKDATISELVYRENLTDWEFLKELAERHGQILFTNSKSDKLQIVLGFKAFKEFKTDDSARILRRTVPMEFYKRLESNTYEGARSAYFAETTLLTHEVKIGAGYGVNFENAVQAVIFSHVYTVENFLMNEITLRHAEGCRADAFDVTKYYDKFYYITGKVLEAKNTNIKIQFDCDEKQSKDDALEIPYESAASNYLYNMPDENDKVFVYVDNIRQAAMGSLRAKEVADAAENRSFKVAKNSALILYPKKISFTAEEKTALTEEDGVKLDTPKDINISSKGDILIQSAGAMMPDNQLTMTAPHMAGYAQYLAGLGQPATIQFNPAGSTVGKVSSAIKNEGTKKESVELSELAKELDKKTGRKSKSENATENGGGSGGTLKLDAKKSAIIQVKDSSIEMQGKNLNVKTRALIQVGYIPLAGGGTGSLSKFEGGSPKNRSDKINIEHGREDRARVKEQIKPTPDNKTISR